MKKIIVFMLLITGITYMSCLTTYAQTTNFYEGEYIEGIWMNRYNPNTKTTYYQKARFFRQSGTNEFAYCIEPFEFFNDNASYESTNTPYNLSNEQINRIKEIAHFGYNYKNHTESKWYAITQFMIWQTSDPIGDYYFTDKLNGNRTNYFQDEINEINNLIYNYNLKPSINNNTYYKVKDNELIIEDTNKVLEYYSTDNNNLKLENNNLIINNNDSIENTYTLKRKDDYYNKPIIFYQSSNSQNLVETGDINELTITFKVIEQETNISISKIDKDTKTTSSSGDASLDNAVYGLYDENNNLIDELAIINNKAEITNINYGKYYLKELKAGEGYTLDKEIHEFVISKDNYNINLVLENKVIENKVNITKYYGTEDNLNKEVNIEFNIYNSKNELINKVVTDEQGKASIILPYGSYTLEQVNTTKGYNKTNPFDFIIDNNEKELEYELYDYEIEVPNTYSTDKDKYKLLKLLLIILIII